MSKSKLAPDWLHKSEQPIRSQESKLTKLLTMTKTHKFPVQERLHRKKCLLPDEEPESAPDNYGTPKAEPIQASYRPN